VVRARQNGASEEPDHESYDERMTGGLQDLTDLLGTASLGFRVQVQSDVVPEPGTLLLLGTGLVGLAAGARRTRR
jgi:hypothetical protein